MLVKIFDESYDFCKFLEKNFGKNLLTGNEKRARESQLSTCEIMTISIYYHYSGYKTFKDYYLTHVTQILSNDFPKLVSYNRFIELRKKIFIPLALFSKFHRKGKCTGISIIDSFCIKVCHSRRQYSHKIFKNIAKKGMTSVGWFYGFKVHLIINENGEIVNFTITTGNVADNNKKNINILTQNVSGKLIADKGYIGLFKTLHTKGIQLIHKIRKNMKNKLMLFEDKLLLRRRGIIETVIGVLKEKFSIEHARHRSKTGFLSHIFTSIIAYNFKTQKPSIFPSRTEYVKTS